MESAARLIDVRVPADPEGVVIVLHGGATRRDAPRVSPTQLSVVRMIPLAAGIARAGEGRLAVLRLLNSRRGWDREHTPLQDVRWAIGELGTRLGAGCPVCLVGHSLGGRAALLAAGAPAVRGVVALAPWVYPDDRPEQVDGARVVIVHGAEDRVADPEHAHTVARRMADDGAAVSFVTVARGTHSMLRRRSMFDGLAARLALWLLTDEVRGPIVARIAGGERRLEV